MNMMRKKNNNNMRRGGGGGNNRRFNHGGGGGGNRNNDGQNIARQKHHATQMREKYTNMARDAQNNGDRVDVEYYLQHVDHYNRVLTDIAAIEAERFAERQAQHQPQGGQHEGGEAAEGAEGADAGAEGAEPITPGNQPRMTRGHRRERHHQPQQQAPQGGEAAAESTASANNQDIPLPESILPVI